MNERIVVITGAAPLHPDAVASVTETAIVLAVDGGLDQALAAGLEPSGLIGDLDSVTEHGLAWAEEHATISRHPADKDRTDTELALAFAAAMNPAQLTLIGGGDRLDHTIAALGALGATELTSVPHLDAWWAGQHIDVVHGPGSATLHLEPASTLSLLALHGRCRKVSIDGVRWPLEEVELAPVIGLGVSNEVLGNGPADSGDADAAPASGRVDIRLSTGVLTVFDTPPPPTIANDITATEATP